MSQPTSRTLTVTFPDVVGGVFYAQLTATLHNSSGPAVLAGTGVGPIYEAAIAADGTSSLPLYANDDPGTQPVGSAWTVWAELILADGRSAQYAAQTIQLSVADPASVDLGTLTPAITTASYTYITTITSTDGSVVVTQSGSTVDVSVPTGGHPFETATPLADSGTGSAGTATTVNRGDHVHPLSSAYATATALNAETTARQSADTALQASITANTTNIATNTTNIATNTAAIASEVTTRASADTTLQTNITAETTARSTADSTHAALTTTAHGGIVASTDARLTDARTPTAHATSHITGGSDVIADAVAGTSSGLLAASNQDTQIQGQDPTASSTLHTLRVILSNLWTAISTNTTAVAARLVAANNLSDISSASTARSNLGVGFYDLAGGTIGKPSASAVVTRFEAVRAFSLPSGYTGSKATAGTAATASTTFTLAKNGSSIGTIVYGASSSTGTVSGTGGSFAAGDILTVTAPSSADATLSDLAFTLAGVL